MKHSPPPAKPEASLIALLIFALALFAAACASQPQRARNTSSADQLGSDASQTAGVSAVNINTASPEQLEKLPGIGAAIAERIIVHRQQYGHFRRAEHLLMVRGISDRKFRVIRPMICVDD